jgi:hypothetical protein
MFNSFFITFASIPTFATTLFSPVPNMPAPLSERTISLENRYPIESVNTVFKDNILLTTAYMRNDKINPQNVDWNEVTKPFHYEFTLKPKETFAFHEDVLPDFDGKVSKTTNAHYNAQEGFLSDGYLYGDGVCHLASLMYWAAKDAQLDAKAPTNHDFRDIPQIPKTYGVSIYSMPDEVYANAQQNLYITNNKDKPVTFTFDYKENVLRVAVYPTI